MTKWLLESLPPLVRCSATAPAAAAERSWAAQAIREPPLLPLTSLTRFADNTHIFLSFLVPSSCLFYSFLYNLRTPRLPLPRTATPHATLHMWIFQSHATAVCENSLRKLTSVFSSQILSIWTLVWTRHIYICACVCPWWDVIYLFACFLLLICVCVCVWVTSECKEEWDW